MSPGSQTALLETYAAWPFSLVAGRGEQVVDDSGRAWLDLYGGHCVASTGHAHPAVVRAIREQADRLLFYSAAARLPVREQAAEALVDFAPQGLDRVFFCNSGAEANENALRVAAMLTGRRRFLAFEGGFHGRTGLAMSVSDLPALHARAPGLQVSTDWLPFGDMAALAQADLSDVAAVIVEPIQSMAGVRTASRSWFRLLRALCNAAGVPLIFDEIQTGVGRLGVPFAADLYEVRPDMLTVAKGLASGVPIGALLMSERVAKELKPGDLGSTFGGGPLASAALLATLDVIRGEGLMDNARTAEAALRRGLGHSLIREIRGEGLLLGLDAGHHAPGLKRWLEDRGILVGGSKDPAVLRLMPPLTLSRVAIARFVNAVHAFAGDLGSDPDSTPTADEETQSCST